MGSSSALRRIPPTAARDMQDPARQALSDRANPENLVEFFQRERMIASGYGAEDFRVEFDLGKRHAVMDAQIETLSHRAHLRC